MTLFPFASVRRVVQLVMLLVAVATLPMRALAADDFLPPEQAFRFAAKQVDSQTVEVRFAIADGYYMYRERFAVAADPAVATGPGRAVFPTVAASMLRLSEPSLSMPYH